MLIIGHRGCSYEPENTLRACERAINLGADMIELDVRASRDDILMVIHDATLERTTTGKGLVRDYSASELGKFDAGHGEKIPMLTEVYDLINGRAMINMEVKARGIEALLVDFLHKTDAYEQVIVSSFDQQALTKIKSYDANIMTGLLVYGVPLHLSALLAALHVVSYHPDAEFLCPADVLIAHVAGCKVFPYTVNEPEKARTLAAWGADGLITDYPDKVRQTVML